MHRWVGAIIGVGAGTTVNAQWGADIATVILPLLGHLTPEVTAAWTRIISGAVTGGTMILTNVLMSRWGDMVVPAKVQ